MLNPDQFKVDHRQRKMDLGEDLNGEHDDAVSGKNWSMDQPLMMAKHLPGVSKPEPGYYDQPKSSVRQMALPGMEMSVNDHLKALGERTGRDAELWTGDGSHQLILRPKSGPTWRNQSYLDWNAHRTEGKSRYTEHVPDGEIQMIASSGKGHASAMLGTAEALAHEHGYTFPKHSESRTPEGVAWSQTQMRRRGERVW